MPKLKSTSIQNIFEIHPFPVMGLDHNSAEKRTSFSIKNPPITRSLDYFQNCFKILHFTCVVPYWFEINNGEAFIRSNPIIKYCVGFLHLYGLLLHGHWFSATIQAIRSNKTMDPNMFCILLANIVLVHGTFNFLYLVWFKKEAFLKFYELLANVIRSNINDSGYTLYERTELFLSLGTVLLFSGLAVIANPWMVMVPHFGVNLAVLESRPIIFGACKFLTYFIFCFVVLMINVSSTLANIGCIAVYRLGKECIEILRTCPPLEEVAKYYEHLKQGILVMNDIIGIQVLTCVLNVLLYFSKTLIEIFEPSKAAQAGVAIMYIIICIVFFMMAAIGSKNLGRIDDYLFRNRNAAGFRNDMCSVLLLKEDISSHALGLKAYEFIVNFNFLVNIFSTVLTYLVVLLQFPNSSTTNIFP